MKFAHAGGSAAHAGEEGAGGGAAPSRTSTGMPLGPRRPFSTPAAACMVIFMAATAEMSTRLKYAGEPRQGLAARRASCKGRGRVRRPAVGPRPRSGRKRARPWNARASGVSRQGHARAAQASGLQAWHQWMRDTAQEHSPAPSAEAALATSWRSKTWNAMCTLLFLRSVLRSQESTAASGLPPGV